MTTDDKLICSSKKKMEKKVWQTTNFILFLDFMLLYQFFLAKQVKRQAIITYKLGIDELPPELLNNLTLSINGKQKIPRKCVNFTE